MGRRVLSKERRVTLHALLSTLLGGSSVSPCLRGEIGFVRVFGGGHVEAEKFQYIVQAVGFLGAGLVHLFLFAVGLFDLFALGLNLAAQFGDLGLGGGRELLGLLRQGLDVGGESRELAG